MEGNYFSSYENIEVHHLMLNDKPRTEAYMNAILKNQHLFKGKLVMDVGAGTGIISLFLAKAGARKVYAIEASNLAPKIMAIAKENGFEDIIEVFHTKVEDFVLPTEEKVDVLVSEWMGFFLLHESMLPSVLHARDNFLSDDGTIFPSEARLYAAPCALETLYKDKFYFWDNVCGFSMSTLKAQAFQALTTKPEICLVPSSDLLAEPICIKTLNLRFISEEDLQFQISSFVGISKEGNFQGVVLWFVCEFDGTTYDESGAKCGTIVTLSTSPFDPATHWKQTVIILGALKNSSRPPVEGSHNEPLIPRIDSQDDGLGGCAESFNQEHLVEEEEIIGWKLEFRRDDQNKRHYNIILEMLDPDVEEHPIPCFCPLPQCLIIAKMIENENKFEDET